MMQILLASDPLWATLFAGVLGSAEQDLGAFGWAGGALIVSGTTSHTWYRISVQCCAASGLLLGRILRWCGTADGLAISRVRCRQAQILGLNP